MTFAEFERMARSRGLVAYDHGGGHWKVIGPNTVSFYPATKRGSVLYVAGTTRGRRGSAHEAIDAAVSAPPIASVAHKDHRHGHARNQKRRLLRIDPRCFWCRCPLDLETATIDHRIPLHRGGLDNANNRVLACRRCNEERGHDMPELERRDEHATDRPHGQ